MPIEEKTEKESPSVQVQPDSSLAIVSMVLGVVSLTGPGLLLGVPAIVTASIALKKRLGGRGLSIAGLVTGIVSTVFSILFLLLFTLLAVWAADHPAEYQQYKDQKWIPNQSQQQYDSSRT